MCRELAVPQRAAPLKVLNGVNEHLHQGIWWNSKRIEGSAKGSAEGSEKEGRLTSNAGMENNNNMQIEAQQQVSSPQLSVT